MTRIRAWRKILVGGGVLLAAYAVFLLVLAPATLLDVGLRHATGGRLRLALAQGTLWSGSGQVEVRDQAGRCGAGKAVAWRLQPLALWRGRLDFAVTVDHAAKAFPLQLSPRRIEVSDVDFSLPARVLGVAVPRLAPLDPQGELVLHVAKFAAVGDVVTADGVVTWKDASSAATAVAPLGTYELGFDGKDGPVRLTLRTLDGPLRLAGGGVWRGGAPPALTITARVAPAQRAQLTPFLRLVAVERGDGDFALQWNPQLGSAGVPRSVEKP
jgi:general secretion pathway protein N